MQKNVIKVNYFKIKKAEPKSPAWEYYLLE